MRIRSDASEPEREALEEGRGTRMLKKATINHIKVLLKSREAILTFFILLFLVLKNFIENVLIFQGRDVTGMYHPMKLLMLSYNRTIYSADTAIIFMLLFPFLVVFPAGFSYVKDRQSREEIYLAARLGRRTYYISKLAAAFFSTMIVFTVPFLIEVCLNCISFPLNAAGDFWNLEPYNIEYVNMVKQYLLSGLYVKAPFLYTVLGILLVGCIAGALAVFTVGISYLFKIRYRVILLLPVFLLLNGIALLEERLPYQKAAVHWIHYVMLFDDGPKNGWYIVGFFLVMFAFALICIHKCGNKEVF